MWPMRARLRRTRPPYGASSGATSLSRSFAKSAEAAQGRGRGRGVRKWRTEMEEVHTIRMKIVGTNPMACELTLDLVRSRITTNELFRVPDLIVAVVVPILAPRPLVLARGARFAARLEPRGVEPCDATVRSVTYVACRGACG